MALKTHSPTVRSAASLADKHKQLQTLILEKNAGRLKNLRSIFMLRKEIARDETFLSRERSSTQPHQTKAKPKIT